MIFLDLLIYTWEELLRFEELTHNSTVDNSSVKQVPERGR